jgi:hypothetical protein
MTATALPHHDVRPLISTKAKEYFTKGLHIAGQFRLTAVLIGTEVVIEFSTPHIGSTLLRFGLMLTQSVLVIWLLIYRVVHHARQLKSYRARQKKGMRHDILAARLGRAVRETVRARARARAGSHPGERYVTIDDAPTDPWA